VFKMTKNIGNCQKTGCPGFSEDCFNHCKAPDFLFKNCQRFEPPPAKAKAKRGGLVRVTDVELRHSQLWLDTPAEAAEKIGLSVRTIKRLRKQLCLSTFAWMNQSTLDKLQAACKPPAPQDPPLPNQSLLGSKHHLINECRTPKIGELCVSIGGSMILRVDKNVESHQVFGTRRHIVEDVPEMVICDHAEDCFDPTCDCFFRTKHTKEGSFLLQLCMGQKVKRIPVSEVEEPAKWDYDPKTYPLSINSLGGVTITSTPLKPQRYTHIGAGDGEGRTCTHFLDPAGHEQDLPLVWERDDEPGYRGVMCPETHPVLCASAVYQRIEVTA